MLVGFLFEFCGFDLVGFVTVVLVVLSLGLGGCVSAVLCGGGLASLRVDVGVCCLRLLGFVGL